MTQPLTNKVLLLGVDGLDPRLTSKFLKEGKLPHIKEFVDRGAQKEDLKLICTPPTITPPLWTTLATGALPVTHGITCFWRQDPVHLDTAGYNLDSRLCHAEPLWNVTAEAGMKTLVWHWPGSSWPPTSQSPNLHVIDGTQPTMINGGVARVDLEKIVLAKEEITELTYKAAAVNNTGAGCVIEDLPEIEDTFDANSILGGDAMSMRNIILKQSDGEDGIDAVKLDLCNSPIKPAKGWANAPEDAKEFYVLTSKGRVRRPCLILKNEDGIYDTVAYYHSKKDEEPIVTMKKDEYKVNVVDDMFWNEEHVYGNRHMLLMDIEPDGSMVRLWLSRAMNIEHDHLFHPRSLHKQIVENVGYIPPNPTSGGTDLELVNRIIIPTWDVAAQWQADALNYLIDTNDYQVVFSHIHNVDAMGHMFWFLGKDRPNMGSMHGKEFQEAIEKVYEQTDRYLGRFLHYLDEGWTIMIFSDHGLLTPEEEEKPLIGDAFGCNVAVMKELGFTVLKKDENGNEIKEIDWEKTRAVATRGGHIYINLKGKYPTGIVDPADKYELEREIIDALYSYRLNGKRVIAVAMRNKDAMVLGTGGPECGDVLYWLEEGVNRLHGDALPMVEGVNDTSVTPIFIAAGQGLKKGYKSERIIRQADVTPTVAHMLGVRIPKQCEGAVAYQILEDYVF
ncbi:MAG: alkaline phosphatase family protein [Peptococcaceae bacterium]|nr:alkaline phosphatase family protein [Peptococcaceae bacterium]